MPSMHQQHPSSSKSITPLDLVFSCTLCLQTASEIFAASDTPTTSSDQQPKPRVPLWLTSCAHVVCSDHFDEAATSGFTNNEHLKSPCPFCEKQNQDRSTKSIYPIRGFEAGQYSARISQEWCKIPPVSLDADTTEVQALRFQFIGLIRSGTGNLHKLRALEVKHRDLVNQLQQKDNAITELQGSIDQMKQAQKQDFATERMVRHFLSSYHDMISELQAAKQRLAELGEDFHGRDYSFNDDTEAAANRSEAPSGNARLPANTRRSSPIRPQPIMPESMKALQAAPFPQHESPARAIRTRDPFTVSTTLPSQLSHFSGQPNTNIPSYSSRAPQQNRSGPRKGQNPNLTIHTDAVFPNQDRVAMPPPAQTRDQHIRHEAGLLGGPMPDTIMANSASHGRPLAQQGYLDAQQLPTSVASDTDEQVQSPFFPRQRRHVLQTPAQFAHQAPTQQHTIDMQQPTRPVPALVPPMKRSLQEFTADTDQLLDSNFGSSHSQLNGGKRFAHYAYNADQPTPSRPPIMHQQRPGPMQTPQQPLLPGIHRAVSRNESGHFVRHHPAPATPVSRPQTDGSSWSGPVSEPEYFFRPPVQSRVTPRHQMPRHQHQQPDHDGRPRPLMSSTPRCAEAFTPRRPAGPDIGSIRGAKGASSSVKKLLPGLDAMHRQPRGAWSGRR